MTCSRSPEHGKKIKVEDDQEQVVCSHDFWNEAPDDVLTEIFIRHPDSRSALWTTPVCRRWRSLISRNPHFIERFNSHHRRHHHDRYPPESLPWAVVFRSNSCSEANICHVYSDEWLFLHGKLPDNCFDFLPNSSNMQIKASCNALFLVSSDDESDLYICNPITKQFVHLPAGPRLDGQDRPGVFSLIAYAVVNMPPGFKVVKALLFYGDSSRWLERDRLVVQVAVFCSVSRRWGETRSIPRPGLDSGLYGYPYTNNLVTVDGVLYWTSRRESRQVLVYLDLSKDRFGTIRIPSHENCRNIIRAIPISGGLHELRLLQIDGFTEDFVWLTVWRLNNNRDDDDDFSSNWFSVHGDITLLRPENSSQVSTHEFEGVFFHPTNGDLVLYVWGGDVIEFNLVDSTYKKIAELPDTDRRRSILDPFLMFGASDSAGF